MDKNRILDFFFPKKCVFCREIVPRGEICTHCRDKVEHFKIPSHLQYINKKEFKNVDLCISFYYYEDIVRQGMINAKNKGCESFLDVFLQYISFDLENFLKDNRIDVMISMPFHRSKYYKKEFDLPQLMAGLIAKKYCLEYNKDLAEKVGVSRQTINALENGKYNPSLVVAHKITQLLNKKHIEEVFIFEDEETGE